MRGLTLLLGLLCCGCGLGTWFEGPKFADEPVPPDKARIVIYRPEWHWIAIDLRIGVDGTMLADLNGATYVSVLVTPRQLPRSFKLTAKFESLWKVILGGSEGFTRRVEARPGETIYCEYTSDASNSLVEQRWFYCSTDPKEHEARAQCRRTGPQGLWDP